MIDMSIPTLIGLAGGFFGCWRFLRGYRPLWLVFGVGVVFFMPSLMAAFQTGTMFMDVNQHRLVKYAVLFPTVFAVVFTASMSVTSLLLFTVYCILKSQKDPKPDKRR